MATEEGVIMESGFLLPAFLLLLTFLFFFFWSSAKTWTILMKRSSRSTNSIRVSLGTSLSFMVSALSMINWVS